MIITKTCNTCEHFPNDKHCVGCVWDKGENTKWELKKNPIVIERAVLDKIKAEIEQIEINGHIRDVECFRAGIDTTLNVINKYKMESEE